MTFTALAIITRFRMSVFLLVLSLAYESHARSNLLFLIIVYLFSFSFNFCTHIFLYDDRLLHDDIKRLIMMTLKTLF